MNLDELKNEINTYEDEKAQVIYIQRIGKKNYNYISFSPILNASLEEKVREGVFSNLNLALNNKEIIEFDPVVTETDTIEVISADKVDNLIKMEPELSALKANSISDIDIENIWGYAIVLIKDDGSKLILFRKYAYPKIFKKGFMCTLADGCMKKLNEKVISIDNQVDSIYIDDEVYILNKYYFESFFNFSQAYKDVVDKQLSNLEKLNIIDNFEGFSKRCLKSDRLTKQFVKLVYGKKFEWIKSKAYKIPKIKEEFHLNITVSNNKIIYNEDDSVKNIIDLISGHYGFDAVDDSKIVIRGFSTKLNN